MRLDINLATLAYEDARRFWTYWGTALALLGLSTALLVFLAVTGFVNAGRDRAQIATLNGQLAALEQEKSQAETMLNLSQNRQVRDRSRFLNGLFQRKTFSWTRVFEDLEQVMPAHLHVVSIHPDMSSDNSLEIKLVVAGESREQADDLVRKMEGSKRFKQTRIDSEKFETTPGPGSDRVQFDITALYVPLAEATENSGGMN